MFSINTTVDVIAWRSAVVNAMQLSWKYSYNDFKQSYSVKLFSHTHDFDSKDFHFLFPLVCISHKFSTASCQLGHISLDWNYSLIAYWHCLLWPP